MVITKDLGAVSAYAYAVEQGYQGTEEEFAELMARQATVAEEAAASADAAAESASEAQASAEQAEQSAQSISGDVERAEQAATTATGKATEAATSATTANGAAQTATGKAAQAEQSATAAANSASAAATSASNAASSATAAQTAKTAAETAQGKAEDAQAAAEAAAASIDPDTLVKKTELEDYAKIDGSYETMTVGNAEQLVATVGVDDNAPYNFRTSGGSVDIGDRETVNAVVGGTVAWNQLVDKSKFLSSISLYGITYTNNGNGSLTFDVTETSDTSRRVPLTANTLSSYFTVPYQHKYIMFDNAPAPTGISYYNAYTGATIGWNKIVIQTQTSGYILLGVAFGASVSVGTYTLTPQIIDLTQMFDTTIADYIYSLETATPGAGVAYFRKLFPKDYYAYNSGELLSVNTSQHKMVGFNAYDNSIGKAKVAGGNQYEITGAYTSLSLDGETITPVSGKFTPSVSGELTVTGGGSNTCIHLVWDGERDGEYEPYKEWVYPLDSSLTLRGIPKLDASNNLYYDGDSYEADGTVTRKYNYLLLDGDESWALQSINEHGIANFLLAEIDEYGHPQNSRCNRFALQTSSIASTTDEGYFFTANEYLYVRISSSKASTVAELKTWLAANLTEIIYELETPTTETADAYTQIQSVDDFGTEEYTDYAYENGDRDVAIPVGNNTVYSPNLRAKLEMSPNSPDGDGLYVVEQSNGQNEYVPLVIPTELPTAPSEDGTYTLKITVSGGTVTKSWIAEE